MKKIMRLKDNARAISNTTSITCIIISDCFYLCFTGKKILHVGGYCMLKVHYYNYLKSLVLFAKKDNAPSLLLKEGDNNPKYYPTS